MTYYDILEVSHRASKEVMEKAYKVLAKKYHPDVNPLEKRSQCEEHMKAINVAYETLIDDEKRRQYDAELNAYNTPENEQTSNEEPIDKEFVDMLKPRPWARYFARSIDIFIGAIAVVYVWNYINADSYNAILGNINEYVFGAVLYGIWLFVEALIISLTATTPGKWLFNIYVLDKYGNRVDYKTSLKRSFLVFYRGLGLGIPLISLFTLTKAYGKLTTNVFTSWDIDCGTVAISKKITTPQIIVSAAIIIGLFVGVTYLNVYQTNLENSQQAFVQQMNDMYTQIENEEKELIDMQGELDSDYQEFIELEEQMIIWLESDTVKYDENYPIYDRMMNDYKDKLEEFESRREIHNQSIEDYNKKLESQGAK